MNIEFKKFVKQIFQDSDGAYSSKRVVVNICLILVAITVIANLFWLYVPTQFIFDSLIWLILGAAGISSFTEKGVPFRSVTKTVSDKTVTANISTEEADPTANTAGG